MTYLVTASPPGKRKTAEIATVPTIPAEVQRHLAEVPEFSLPFALRLRFNGWQLAEEPGFFQEIPAPKKWAIDKSNQGKKQHIFGGNQVVSREARSGLQPIQPQ
jgi:hypothetical protein